jgi:pimeloyl-ACP methyl ester carboxylesterase
MARVHMIGHSYGAVTALQLTCEAPSVVHPLVLLDPPKTTEPYTRFEGYIRKIEPLIPVHWESYLRERPHEFWSLRLLIISHGGLFLFTQVLAIDLGVLWLLVAQVRPTFRELIVGRNVEASLAGGLRANPNPGVGEGCPASSMQVRHPRLPQNLPTQLGLQAENISCRYGRPALHPCGSPLDSGRGLDKAQYRASQNQ